MTPKPELYIEPSAGATYDHPGEFAVYSYGTYPESSVLAGREKRSFVAGGFTSEAEAKAAYPDATVAGASLYREITVPHTAPDWFDPASAGEVWDEDDAY
jgi:hypothetical protein